MPKGYKLPTGHLDDDADEEFTAGSHKGRWILYLSLLFNLIAFTTILRHSHELKGMFSGGTFFGEGWYTGIDEAQPINVDVKHCPSSSRPPLASPPAPVNLWASLAPSETSQIQEWLESPEQNLNLTRQSSSVTSDNVIFMIEAFRPPKHEALSYLANPSNASIPERFSRVTIHHGGIDEPVIKDYLVGPLPVGPQTTLRPLTEIYHRDDIPFNARGLVQITEIAEFLAQEVQPIADVMEALFGGSVRGYENDTLTPGFSGPFSFDGSFTRLWLTWRRNVAGSFLLPVDFYNYVDISGTDPSQWKTLKLVYFDQVFDSMPSFLEAFRNGTLIRHTEQSNPKLDITWPERKRVGIDRDLDHLPGPRSVSFAGLRFRVDRDQQYVSWMGWGMYLGFDRDMGLSLWDIRFRNERIIYQLAPQEAIAQYAGSDPVQATTAWLDRYFGMGWLVNDMIPNYDCPPEAVYLPATTYTILGNFHRERAICIFEQDTGKPISRHFGPFEGEFGAIKGYVLTIRSIATVGNYDYCESLPFSLDTDDLINLCFDYIFQLDGTIEVRLSASGYMQGGYWNSAQDDYGARIRDFSMGNLHDHVVNYKVDFDIAGTSNSLLCTTTEQEEVTHPWLGDDWGQKVIQQKITREYVKNENDALLKYPPNFQGGYAIVNQESKNSWGIPRGYAIHPGVSPIHNTVVGSKRLLNNANWARYNLAVSRRKDTEPSSSCMWNQQLSGAPAVNFHNFFDGENITQQDLVAWINVGMHHLPQAEDSPNTKTNVATSSFTLTPLNYFDMDVSMELRNAILFHPPMHDGDPYTFDDYGVKVDETCLPETPPPLEYSPNYGVGSDGSRISSLDVTWAPGVYPKVKAAS